MPDERPECYLRLPQIIGSDRANPKKIEPSTQKKKHKTERPYYPAIIPVSRSQWWDGVAKGKYPSAYKLGPRTTVWLASEIYALLKASKL